MTAVENPFEAIAAHANAQSDALDLAARLESCGKPAQPDSPEISEVDMAATAHMAALDGLEVASDAGKEGDLPKWIRPASHGKVCSSRSCQSWPVTTQIGKSSSSGKASSVFFGFASTCVQCQNPE